MNKNIIIHAGMHKTATTSIQYTLIKNRKTLNKYNFDILNGKDFHNEIKYHGIGNDLKSAYVKDIKKMCFDINNSKLKNIIISSENFCWILDSNKIDEIKTALKKHNVKIIFYIRRQDLQLVSHFQEASKYEGGMLKPAKTFYGNGNNSIPDKHVSELDDYLNYYKKIKIWSDSFGKENIIVKIFEKEHLLEEDPVADFIYSLGLNHKEFDKVKANTSNGFESVKVGHILTKYTGKISKELELKIRDSLNNNNKILPSKEIAKNIYDYYSESNKMLMEAFELDSLFNNDFTMYPEKRNDFFNNKSANDAIEKILDCCLPLIELGPDILRDAALSLEKTNLNKSLQLMTAAKSLRPNGPLINRKINEYKSKINEK